jgi:hypothetical protein
MLPILSTDSESARNSASRGALTNILPAKSPKKVSGYLKNTVPYLYSCMCSRVPQPQQPEISVNIALTLVPKSVVAPGRKGGHERQVHAGDGHGPRPPGRRCRAAGYEPRLRRRRVIRGIRRASSRECIYRSTSVAFRADESLGGARVPQQVRLNAPSRSHRGSMVRRRRSMVELQAIL